MQLAPLELLGILRPQNDNKPKFWFGDRVVLDNGCQPDSWNTGVVTGINALIYRGCTPNWEYCIHFDSPIGSREWHSEGIHLEATLDELQQKWEERKLWG